MAIDTLDKLKARLGFLANRDDLFSNISIGVVEIEDAITTAIGNATTQITRDLVRRGGTALQEVLTDSLTTTSGTETVALPSTFAGAKFFSIQTDPVQILTPKDFTSLINDNPSQSVGKPSAYALYNQTTAYLRPIPDATYTLRLIYYRRLAALTSSTTNAIFDAHPDIYEAAGMIELALALEDDVLANKWRVVYDQRMNDLTDQDKMSGWAAAMSGATPSVSVVIA